MNDHDHDRRMDMETDEREGARAVKDAEELDTDRIREAMDVLEGSLSHGWFAGLPEIEWDKFRDRTRDLDTARLP